MELEEYAEWGLRFLSRFEVWQNATVADIQPFLKYVRVWYIRLHYKPFFKQIVD